MSELKPFEDKLAALIAAMSPAGRRRLSTEIGRTLRQKQQQRIKAQRAPDGTPYEARKPQAIRGKQGRVKREMFAKLRTSRYMKASGSDSAAVVEFTGKVQRIARIHQFGLKDRPARNRDAVDYPVRPLLGFSADERDAVERLLIAHLAE